MASLPVIRKPHNGSVTANDTTGPRIRPLFNQTTIVQRSKINEIPGRNGGTIRSARLFFKDESSPGSWRVRERCFRRWPVDSAKKPSWPEGAVVPKPTPTFGTS